MSEIPQTRRHFPITHSNIPQAFKKQQGADVSANREGDGGGNGNGEMRQAPIMKIKASRAPWWIPVPSASSNAYKNSRNRKQRPSCVDALKDLLQNISLHCYDKLVEPGRRFQERFLWLIFHLTTLTFLIIILWNTQARGSDQLVTSIFNSLYPIRKVPFPAVSICSINRISNATAMRYAVELNEKDEQKRGVSYFQQEIRMLSYLYSYQNADFERAVDFQSFLDTFDTSHLELFFNPRNRLQMMTPSCEESILECRLAGRRINCTEEIEQTLTSYGFCCTFNSDGRYARERSFRQRFFDRDDGLVILLNTTTADDYYRMYYMDGFTTLIHAYADYAATFSGAVHERLVQAGTDTFLQIKPKLLETVQEARYLSPEARNCYFENEQPRLYGRQYSFNKCITRCRVHSVLALCHCIHFQTPFEYLDLSTNAVFCTLQHIECLKRYRFKWLNVLTRRRHLVGLEQEIEDSLYCPECLPSCSETRYAVSASNVPLNSYNVRSFGRYVDSNNNTDLAILRVAFGEAHTIYLRRILKDSWFEVMSTIGSICGVITGFSLIAFCELLFFLIRQIIRAYKSESYQDQQRRRAAAAKSLIILP